MRRAQLPRTGFVVAVCLAVRDRTDPQADGLYSVCYVNAFQTRPDERDQWPADVLLTVDGSPVHDPDWLWAWNW